MRILIIEDDRRMAQVLCRGLAEEGHSVVAAVDGAEGLRAAMDGEFDVMVLDVMLPVMDGFDVARRLRRAGIQTPILMLTARDKPADIVDGLDIGADDYLTKPFAFEVLLARIRALSRRRSGERSPQFVIADLTLDPATREVSRAGEMLHLTKTEFGLLETLMRRGGRVVSREALLEAVWGYDRAVENNTLDAFMSSLRQKVDRGERPRLMHTVRGIGYCMRVDTDRAD